MTYFLLRGPITSSTVSIWAAALGFSIVRVAFLLAFFFGGFGGWLVWGPGSDGLVRFRLLGNLIDFAVRAELVGIG